MFGRILRRNFSAAGQSQLKYLTEEQVTQFHKDGWLHLPGALSSQLTKDFTTWVEEIMAWPETAGKWMKYYEYDPSGERLPCRIENFVVYHDKMKEFVLGYCQDLATDLFGEEAAIYKEKINFKYPQGGSFKAHQDAPAYVSFTEPDMISVLVPIDENTRKSGGLDFVKKHDMDYVMPINSDGSIRTDLDAKMFWEPTDCYPGDIFLFDAYAPHRSDINISPNTRRNCYLTYNRLSKGHFHSQYYETKRAAFPPDIERDPNKDYSEGAKVFNVANPIK